MVSPPRARSLLATLGLLLTAVFALAAPAEAADAQPVISKKLVCPFVAAQGTIVGRDAPTFKIDAGKHAIVRIVAESCDLVDWRTRTLKRTSGTLGPVSVKADSDILSRRRTFSLAVVAPDAGGTYSATYALVDANGKTVAPPVTIAIEVFDTAKDCAKLSLTGGNLSDGRLRAELGSAAPVRIRVSRPRSCVPPGRPVTRTDSASPKPGAVTRTRYSSPGQRASVSNRPSAFVQWFKSHAPPPQLGCFLLA